jgi:hypothetical protein
MSNLPQPKSTSLPLQTSMAFFTTPNVHYEGTYDSYTPPTRKTSNHHYDRLEKAAYRAHSPHDTSLNEVHSPYNRSAGATQKMSYSTRRLPPPPTVTPSESASCRPGSTSEDSDEESISPPRAHKMTVSDRAHALLSSGTRLTHSALAEHTYIMSAAAQRPSGGQNFFRREHDYDYPRRSPLARPPTPPYRASRQYRSPPPAMATPERPMGYYRSETPDAGVFVTARDFRVPNLKGLPNSSSIQKAYLDLGLGNPSQMYLV